MDELERLAGSVLCVGVPGAILGDPERRALETIAPGALVLFARNVSTCAGTTRLLADARAAIGGNEPALGCVDQEGGRVLRLRFARNALPAMAALGATGDEQLAERAGAYLAAELRAIGADVDFAPVLDLAFPGATSVIGTRALGSDPACVARMGCALVRGMQTAGVAATIKHFPGHGDTNVDSHEALPTVNADEATLRARDLLPFAAAISAGARAVMTAHVVVRAFDAERPATLAPRILRTLLREELGFTGVCFTDCLQMNAIANGVGTISAAVLALDAGADVATISHDLTLARAARDAIVAAVRSGTLSEARLREASDRMTDLRRFVAGAHAMPASDDALPSLVARRALTMVRGALRVDAERPVTVVSFEGATGDGIAATAAERPSLSLALRRRRCKSELMRVPLNPSDDVRDALAEVVGAQGDRQLVVLVRRARSYAGQRRAIEALVGLRPEAIVIAMLEPFDADAVPAASTLACTFGDDEPSVEALADALMGIPAA